MSCYFKKKVFWNMLFDRLIISVVGIFLKKCFFLSPIYLNNRYMPKNILLF